MAYVRAQCPDALLDLRALRTRKLGTVRRIYNVTNQNMGLHYLCVGFTSKYGE